jgi:hypothetical protein
MREQRPQVREAIRKERELRVKEGAPDDDRINEAIRAFVPQFRPEVADPLSRPKEAIRAAETAVLQKS